MLHPNWVGEQNFLCIWRRRKPVWFIWLFSFQFGFLKLDKKKRSTQTQFQWSYYIFQWDQKTQINRLSHCQSNHTDETTRCSIIFFIAATLIMNILYKTRGAHVIDSPSFQTHKNSTNEKKAFYKKFSSLLVVTIHIIYELYLMNIIFQ